MTDLQTGYRRGLTAGRSTGRSLVAIAALIAFAPPYARAAEWATGIVTQITQSSVPTAATTTTRLGTTVTKQSTSTFNDYAVQVGPRLYVLRVNPAPPGWIKTVLTAMGLAAPASRSANIAVNVGESIDIMVAGTDALIRREDKAYACSVIEQRLLAMPSQEAQTRSAAQAQTPQVRPASPQTESPTVVPGERPTLRRESEPIEKSEQNLNPDPNEPTRVKAVPLKTRPLPPPDFDTPPKLVYKKEPLYSNAARSARIEGTVRLLMMIGVDGVPFNDIQVAESIGYGLDQAAVECVRAWRFQPATKAGKPVVSPANIEVNFKLLPEAR